MLQTLSDLSQWVGNFLVDNVFSIFPFVDGVNDPKKRKRPTKPKDPNAPKRPASSYILFQNEVRKELKERHPDLTNADLLSLISEQWKSMSDEQKEASRVLSTSMHSLLTYAADL